MFQEKEVDFEAAFERVEGDLDLYFELADLFIQSCSEQLSQIRAALANGAASTLRDIAHSLKSASGNVGAMEVFRLAFEIEKAAAAGALSDAAVLIEPLELATQKYCKAVTKLKAGRRLPHPG